MNRYILEEEDLIILNDKKLYDERKKALKGEE